MSIPYANGTRQTITAGGTATITIPDDVRSVTFKASISTLLKFASDTDDANAYPLAAGQEVTIGPNLNLGRGSIYLKDAASVGGYVYWFYGTGIGE